MYHLRLKGTHYEIGQRRGEIFNKCGIEFPLHLDNFQMKHGIESEKILKQYFSSICEEVKGVTDIIRVDYQTFMSWLLVMGCCMYNIDVNHPIEVRGCTAFLIKHNDDIYYGRNNDLPPFLKKGSKSELYNITNGVKFNINTSSFINGEEGINEYGVVVGMTFVLTNIDKIKPGFNSVFVVRYLLEKAKSTKEAIELLNDIPLASNMNIIIGDKSGDMVVVECFENTKQIRKPSVLPNGLEVVCTTNTFITEKAKKYECKEIDDYQALTRFNTVMSACILYKEEEMIDYIFSILKGKYGFICEYEKKDNFQTIWSSVYHLNDLSAYRIEDDPRKGKLVIDDRMKKII